MTKPKRTAQVARLQQLYSRLNTVAKQIKQEEVRHQEQQRHQEMERVMVYGRLVLLAKMDGTHPELLLGILQDSMAHLHDASTHQRWQRAGAQLLIHDRRLQRTVRRLWPQPPQEAEAFEQAKTENAHSDQPGGRTHDGT